LDQSICTSVALPTGRVIPVKFMLLSQLGYDMLLGWDVIREHREILDCLSEEPIKFSARIPEDLIIGPREVRKIKFMGPMDGRVYFHPNREFEVKYGITLLDTVNKTDNSTTFLSNVSHKEQRFHRNTKIGTMEAADVVTEDRVLVIADVLPTIKSEPIRKVVEDFKHLFVEDVSQLKHTDAVKHRIPLKDDIPLVSRPYRANPIMQKEIEKQTQVMLDNEVIRPSVSEYRSPVVMVKKKDGTFRFCVDYRKLNEHSKKDKYPLPRIEDLLDKLGSAKIFSSLDLHSGYWQIEILEEDKNKTAFSSGIGLYEFNVFPFGLTGAPSTFQRLMDFILQGHHNSAVYLDDILVFAEDELTHATALREVFRRIEEANLRLNTKKCKIGESRINYLGYQVSDKGLEPDPNNIAKVKAFSFPKNARQVRQFIGLCSYYRKFINQFATMPHLCTIC